MSLTVEHQTLTQAQTVVPPLPPTPVRSSLFVEAATRALDTATLVSQSWAMTGGIGGAIIGGLFGVLGAIVRGPITDAIVVAIFGIIVLALAGAIFGAVLLLALGAIYGALAGAWRVWKSHDLLPEATAVWAAEDKRPGER
jgi:hypothetical protein